MELDINKTCCFTGHKPEKIKEDIDVIKANLRKEIMKAIDLGYDTFISGMADGVDVWAAETVLDIKKEKDDIKLICAVAYNGTEKNRTPEKQEKFHDILRRADGTEYMNRKYAPWVFFARDEWMIDRASYVIAVFNGTRGGTEHTLKYAAEKERKIVYVNMKEIES
ncbi:MAG: DUF1273 domain-containing protein [Clostridia bacterium]|nr:DUF1273 domain-containing protein [Clostridia bacterium]